MQYVNLGACGLKVSRIALGMMTFGTTEWRPWIRDEETARDVVKKAVELGINVFDTADMYSAGLSEEITGRVLREFARREEIVIATKVFHPVDLAFKGALASGPKPAFRPNVSGLSRKHILDAVDASLKRLGTDYIDLYQIHRFDAATPVEETMAALDDVVRAGKVRYLGASSMWAWQFAKAAARGRAQRRGEIRVDAEPLQPRLPRGGAGDDSLLPRHGRGRHAVEPAGPRLPGRQPLARGPTGGGDSRARTDDLAQKYYYQDMDFDVVEALAARAKLLGVSNATLAYAWLLARPGVTAPLVGASKPWQLEEAVKSLDGPSPPRM